MLIFVELLTKWPISRITHNATSEEVITFVDREVIEPFGSPKTIVSDDLRCFTSAASAKFISDHGIEWKPVSEYAPMSNWWAERMVGKIKRGVGMLVAVSGRRWEEDLSKAICRYRRRPLYIEASPNEQMYGVQRRFVPTDHTVDEDTVIEGRMRIILPLLQLFLNVLLHWIHGVSHNRRKTFTTESSTRSWSPIGRPSIRATILLPSNLSTTDLVLFSERSTPLHPFSKSRRHSLQRYIRGYWGTTVNDLLIFIDDHLILFPTLSPSHFFSRCLSRFSELMVFRFLALYGSVGFLSIWRSSAILSIIKPSRHIIRSTDVRRTFHNVPRSVIFPSHQYRQRRRDHLISQVNHPYQIHEERIPVAFSSSYELGSRWCIARPH